MDKNMAVTKQKIDDAKNDQTAKAALIKENVKKQETLTNQIHVKIKEKEHFHDKARYIANNRFAMEKEKENQIEAVKVIKDQIEQQNIQIAKSI